MAVCRTCNLDFEKLRVELSYETLARENRIGPRGLYLYCPACGERNEIELKPYNLFVRGEKRKLYRWRGAQTKIENFDGKCRINLGAMILSLSEKLKDDYIAGDNFSVEQICHKAVPVFRQLDGSLLAPDLPVRREYLDLVDTSRRAQSERTARGGYRFTFHLTVAEQPVEVTLPPVPARPGQTPADGVEAFDGVHLLLWPKVNYRAWRRYFLRFGYAGATAEDLFGEARDVKVYAFAGRSVDENERVRDWLQLDTVSPDRRTRFACVESRPEWVGVEFEDGGRGEPTGGGLWRIRPAADAYPELETTVAVDFGTSNTCIAWDAPQGASLLAVKSCDEVLINGASLPNRLEYPDTWPPRQGFGRSQALLPTEILTRENVDEYRKRNHVVRDWVPVLDYSIPTSGVDAAYSEMECVIPDFKWQNMIGDAWYKKQHVDLQKKYIEFLLLIVIAELVTHNAIGPSLNVKFSYPLAFDEEMQDKFVSVLQEATTAVSRQTGVNVMPDLVKVGGKMTIPLDEARAAALSASAYGNDDSACLYVDIGGGSTDIALLELRRQTGRKDTYVNICSFEYAGGGLAAALAEGGCLKSGSDISHFRRKIRETGSVTELMNSDTLFSNNKKKAITNKSSFFYAYLRQFLSRLLAAHIINRALAANGGRPHAEARPAADAPDAPAARAPYRVLLYPLGNGWGFGGFIDTRYATRVFPELLAKETNAILEEAVANKVVPPDVPRVEVLSQAVGEPKDAVVNGLLNNRDTGAFSAQDWPWRSIVGWTTRTSATQKAEWYRPVTGGSASAPPGAEPVTDGAILECPAEEWPAFPSRLPTPHELDERNELTRFLAGCSPSGVEQDWLQGSPFHVLLEKLFKPALKELT
ncbi:MAG TPA: hypothetical protein VK421_08360 [Pyrinomonadaceae bacterium]|nr:hypothetical protein [Pyrinomonadaceae bacterium]